MELEFALLQKVSIGICSNFFHLPLIIISNLEQIPVEQILKPELALMELALLEWY
jgi:hypothetical protein